MNLSIRKKFDFILYTILLPSIISFATYFGYFSRYNNYYYVEKMPDNYFENVYKYRFLSRDIIIWLQYYVKKYIFYIKNDSSFINKVLVKLGASEFYLLIFAYNTVFYILTSIIFFFILNYRSKSHNSIIENLILIISVFIIGLSQYVVTPYDLSSLFLLSLSMLLIIDLNYKYSLLKYILLLIIIVISTLNRETSALSLSFYLVIILNHNYKIDHLIKISKQLFFPILCFLIPYIIIRIKYDNEGYSNSVIMANFLKLNFTEFKNILGIIFYIIFTYLSISLCHKKSQKINIFLYILFSSPYILIILYAGILWEIRLFIPLLLCQLVLSNNTCKRDEL